MIAVIGASGYIGKHLVTMLAQIGDSRVKILSREKPEKLKGMAWPYNVEVTQGNLHDVNSLAGFLETGCTVVNLAYLWDAGESANLTIVSNLLIACKLARVRRLIHCSTAAVVGRISDDLVTESIECRPITEYGITKLKIEQMIISAAQGHFDAAIIRPTSVFGPSGEPLKKLANALVSGNRFSNYLKSCLFGFRSMNLVHVKNVVAAILFLIHRRERIEGEVFIVSDDSSVANNFFEVEQRLMRTLDCQNYALPRVFLPLCVLRLLLGLIGRNSINPKCRYSQEKLQNIGFKSPITFEDGLMEYAEWYRSHFMPTKYGALQ